MSDAAHNNGEPLGSDGERLGSDGGRLGSQNGRRGPVFLVRMFSSLRTRNYRLWFIGQTVSQCGTWMQSVAQYWLVLELTHSAFDLGVTAALQFAPVLLFGTIGGLVADRFDKRKVVLLTQTAFTVQATALWVLVASGSVRIWMVWALASSMGFINVFDNPSRQSFVMEMAGPDDLTNAVSLNSIIVNVSRIVGPALAGILIATVGLSWAFLANAVSFAAVIGALSAMRPSELHRSPPVSRAKGQIRAGLRYAWQAWELRVPLLMMAVMGTLAYNFSVLLPLFAHDVFHRGAGTYSALTVAMGIGALAGGLTIAARQRPSHRLLVAVSLAFGVFILAVAAAPTLPVCLLLLVAMGAASIMFIATANSLLQLNSSHAMRGRVMALWAVVFLGSTPVGAPLIGFLAGRYGPRFALGVGGVATLLVALWAGFALRRIRNTRDAAADEAAPAASGAASFPAIDANVLEGGLGRGR
ncbi:MAG: MFS transporter [Thermoleophilia bacterium]